MPGFGEVYVSVRIRLLLGLAITVVVTPVLAPDLPALPASPWRLLLLLGGEIGVGVFIGSLARVIFAALQTAGQVVAFQTSLANALIFDPTAAQQGALVGAFLSTFGVVLIFVTNLHHLMLGAVVDSYQVFVPGEMPPVGDFSDAMARAVARSFLLAIQISAPFIVVGLIFYLGLGLLARLMPQVQVFFVAMPLQILLGMVVLLLTFSAAMMWFLDGFQGVLTGNL